MLFLVVILMTGTEAHLNPAEIVAVLEAREASDPTKRYAADVRCVIQMSNGEEFTTREECGAIEKRLQALTRGRH